LKFDQLGGSHLIKVESDDDTLVLARLLKPFGCLVGTKGKIVKLTPEATNIADKTLAAAGRSDKHIYLGRVGKEGFNNGASKLRLPLVWFNIVDRA
jgi:hypothetical protein